MPYPSADVPPPNEPIDIAVGEEVLVTGRAGNERRGLAEVRMLLLPNPRIDIKVTYDADVEDLNTLQRHNENRLEVAFPTRGISARLSTFGFSLGQETSVRGTLRAPAETERPTDKMSRVEFLVFNFPDFTARLRDDTTGAHYRGQHVTLDFDEWRVVLSGHALTYEHIKAVRERGGFAVTHRGAITRTDGASVDIRAVSHVLTGLHYYLSFARGMWLGPQLPVGIANGERRVWEQWEVKNVDAWRHHNTWFDYQHGEVLAEVSHGFWELWSNENWELSLRKAIHWFVSANKGAGGVEGGLVLAQTALELLAWVVLVESGHRFSVRAFKKLDAAEQLRQLLLTQGVPSELPSSLRALVALSAGSSKEWDGPAAITAIRNNVVHPERRGVTANASVEARADAWQLALWYVELVLLRLFKFDGVYGNRLRRGHYIGDVDAVPWTAPTNAR
jgi:hypothetical protein